MGCAAFSTSPGLVVIVRDGSIGRKVIHHVQQHQRDSRCWLTCMDTIHNDVYLDWVKSAKRTTLHHTSPPIRRWWLPVHPTNTVGSTPRSSLTVSLLLCGCEIRNRARPTPTASFYRYFSRPITHVAFFWSICGRYGGQHRVSHSDEYQRKRKSCVPL